MKYLFPCLLVAALAGCASPPRDPKTFTVTSPETTAALDAYVACVHRVGAGLKGALTETARDIAAVAVSSCEAELQVVRAAVRAENGTIGFASAYADSYASGIRSRLTTHYATLVMQERSR